MRETWDATRVLLDGIEPIDGIEVLAEPEMCMFTLGSEEINIFELDDEMRRAAGRCFRSSPAAAGPANLHVSISSSNVPLVDRLLERPSRGGRVISGAGAPRSTARPWRARSRHRGRPLEELFVQLVGLAGLTGEGLPERMAPLNTILDLLPAETRDQILTAYINAS